MSGFQLIFVTALAILTAVFGWWLGRRSNRPVVVISGSHLEPPMMNPDAEEALHQRLAKAAAEIVIPLETFFSAGVELNLKTATLTKDLLKTFTLEEAAALHRLHPGQSLEQLRKISEETGRSLAELEALRQRFAEQATAALLPKIKEGLKDRAAEKAPATEASKALLTDAANPEELASLRRELEEAREQFQQLAQTHVPKTRLDSLQEEYAAKHAAHANLQLRMAEVEQALAVAKAGHSDAPQTDRLKEELAAAHQTEVKELQRQLHFEGAENSRQLVEISNALNAAEAKLAELSTTHVSRQSLDELHAEFSGARTGHGELQAETVTLREELERGNLAQAEAARKCEELQSQLSNLQANAEHRNASAMDLHEKVAAAEQDTARAKEAAALFEKELTETGSQLNTALSDMEMIRAELSESKSQADGIGRAMTELQTHLESLQAAADAESPEIQELRVELQSALEGLAAKTEELGAAESREAELRVNVEALQAAAVDIESSKVAEIKLELESALEGLAVKTEELGAAESREAELRANVEALQAAAVDAESSKIAEIKLELEFSLESLAAKTGELDAAESREAELRANVEALQAASVAESPEVAGLKVELLEKAEALAASEARLAEFAASHVPQSSLENLQMEFATKHQANSELAAQVAGLTEELADAKASLLEAQEAAASRPSVDPSELGALQEALTAKEQLCDELNERSEELHAQLAGVREELEEASAALATATKDESSAEVLQQELEQAEMAAKEAKEAAASAEEELEESRSRLASAQEAAESAQEELEAVREELQELKARAGEQEDQLEALQRQVETVSQGGAANAELAEELKVARDAHTRLAAELETARKQVADHSGEVSKADHEALEARLKAAQDQAAALKIEFDTLRQSTVLRSDYEALRNETDKARQELSNALSKYADLKQRLSRIDNAASIEKLKAGLAQEEKAHGVLRIQYRNLESRLYEAVGARKRFETDLKTITKERDQLATQVRAAEKAAVARVKVSLPPEVANPSIEGEGTNGTGGTEATVAVTKKRAARKKAASGAEETVSEVPEPVQIPSD